MSRVTNRRILEVLGKAPKPVIVWQKQFDLENDVLLRLAQTDWDAVHDADLRSYLHDLNYVELQPDLFRHLFPACLKFWYATLLESKSAEGGDGTLRIGVSHQSDTETP